MEHNVHVHIVEALVLEVLLHDELSAVHDVLGDLVALHQVESLLQVLPFAFLHAVVVHLRDARLGAHSQQQPSAVAHGFHQ